MKKRYIIAAACCLIGVALIGGSLGLVNGDFRNYSNQTYVENSYSCSEEINEIEINEKMAGIRLETGNVDHVEIEYVREEDSKMTIEEKDGRLSIVGDSKPFNIVWFSGGYDRTTKITLPASFAGKITIKNNNGYVELADLNLENVEVTNNNGRIRLENVLANDKIYTKNDNGKIELLNVTGANVEASNSNGGVYMTNVKAIQNIIGKNNNGVVSVSQIEALIEISLINSNGRIEGSVKGEESDYNISAHTSNGRSNISNRSGGSRSLVARNSNGSIDISFVK